MSDGAVMESGEVYDTDSLVGGNHHLASKSDGNTQMIGTSIYPYGGKNIVRYAWSLTEEELQRGQ